MTTDFSALAKQLADKTNLVFNEDDAERALEAFKKKGPTIDRKNFEDVFRELFGEDYEDNKTATNSFYLDRLFAFCDTEKSGKITPKQFVTQIGIAYSSEDDDATQFNFAIYDLSRSGRVTRSDFLSALKSFLKSYVEGAVKELEQSSAQKAQNLKKASSEINGKTGEKVLTELVNRAFNDAGGGDSMDFDKFKKAFLSNYEHFAWDKLIPEAMEKLEEILHIES